MAKDMMAMRTVGAKRWTGLSLIKAVSGFGNDADVELNIDP